MHRGGAAVRDAIAGARFLGEEMDRCAVLHQGQHPQVVLLPAVLPEGEQARLGAGAVRQDRGDEAAPVPDRVRGACEWAVATSDIVDMKFGSCFRRIALLRSISQPRRKQPGSCPLPPQR